MLAMASDAVVYGGDYGNTGGMSFGGKALIAGLALLVLVLLFVVLRLLLDQGPGVWVSTGGHGEGVGGAFGLILLLFLIVGILAVSQLNNGGLGIT